MDLRVLGSVVALGAARPIPLAPATRALLAALAVERRSVVPLDRLAWVLWGDHPPGTWRPTLQTHLSRLRGSIELDGDATVVHRPPGYALEIDAGVLDLDRFEEALRAGRARCATDPAAAVVHLDEARRCWSGPALGEFADADWARPEAHRLEELRLVADEEWAEAALAAGAHASVVVELEAVCARNPLREQPWALLMVALHRSGRQAEALRRAQELRRRLADELGLHPSERLVALEGAIARDDPALAAPAPALQPSGAPPPTPIPPPGRLAAVPRATATLVGRADELDRLGPLLARATVLTLTGPGGVGKTTLAHELARRSVPPRDGVRLVELAPVADPAGVVTAVAGAVGIERRAGRTLAESVIEVLAPLELLLVVDNCEHVLDAAADLVEQVVRWCPGVRVLTTSRGPLGLSGESVWPVGPLPVPDPAEESLAAVAGNDAVRVFVQRARDAAPGFELDEGNRRAVAALCSRLDGIPLALELAAARMSSMAPQQLLERLGEPYALLAASHGDARHRSLRDLVQWSYDLLSTDEQLLMARLSIFAGGFDLDLAEHTCADAELPVVAVPLALAGLVDKSLVVTDARARPPRHRQLETIRQFGRAQLERTGGSVAVRHRHLRACADLAAAAGVGIDGPDEAAWSGRLDQDSDNLRAAVATAVSAGDVDAGLRLVVGAHEWAFRRMRYELTGWADDLTSLPEARNHPDRPLAMAVVAYGSFVRGELDHAVQGAHGALAEGARLAVRSPGLAERVLANALVYQGHEADGLRWMDRMHLAAAAAGPGATGRVAHALYMRSVAATSTGRPDQGRRLAEEARCVADRCASATARAQAEYAFGLAAASAGGDGARRDALARLDEAAQLALDAGNRWMWAFAGTEALWLRARLGDTEVALRGYREVVEAWFQAGDWANQWLSLRQLAGVLAEVGRDEAAAVIHGAVEAAGAAGALPLAPSDAEALATAWEQVARRLGPDATEIHRRRGARLREDAVVATALDAIDAVL